MPNSRYVAGSRFERDVGRLLSGWYEVQRAPKSGGVCDLTCDLKAEDFSEEAIQRVILHPDRILYVSCKRNGVCGVTEWNAHYWKARRVAAAPIVACKPKRGGPILLYRMTGPKTGRRGVAQPWQPWEFQPIMEETAANRE
jgi:hypothetical protein